MSLKTSPNAQLEHNAMIVEYDPELVAHMAKREVLLAAARKKYSDEIARLTERIMGHCNSATGNCVRITVELSNMEMLADRLNTKRIGFSLMWCAIIEDLISAGYLISDINNGHIRFRDDKEIKAGTAYVRNFSLRHYLVSVR